MPDSSTFPEPSLDVALLDRYLANAVTVAERAMVDRWIAADPAHAELFVVARTGYQSGVLPEVDVERALVQSKQRAAAATQVRRSRLEGMYSLGSQPLQRWMWIAGAVFAGAIALFVTRPVIQNDQGVTRTYRTTPDQQATVTLPDGSRMTLAPRTTVRLTHFGPHTRTVSLDGEAYFEVAHAEGTPFIVRGDRVTTRVLGTAFLMRATHGQPSARIAVIDGKVAVKALPGSGQVVVAAGYLSEVTDSIIHVTAVNDIASGAEWAHDKLVFRNAPLSVVLETLSRWYGYRFRCTDSGLLQREVTIGVSVRSSAIALSAIERVLRVNLTAVGDTITLKPRPVGPVNGAPRIPAYDIWIPTREVGR